jgi:hypothetical protein
MVPYVEEARWAGEFVLWLRFSDGAVGEVDLREELEGEIFEPLKDPAYFSSFRVALDTVTWPNGADFSPEFLYERMRVRA